MKKFIKQNKQILMVALIWFIGLGGLYNLNQYNLNQINAKQVQIKRQKAREAKIKQDREDMKAIRHNQKYVWSKLG